MRSTFWQSVQSSSALWWPWLLLLVWAVVTGFPWYTLSYTKLRELQAMAGQSYEKQMQVVHPPVMRQLLVLRDDMLARHKEGEILTVLVPPDPHLPPLAGNAAILRALLRGKVVVKTIDMSPVQSGSAVWVVSPETSIESEWLRVVGPYVQQERWEVVL